MNTKNPQVLPASQDGPPVEPLYPSRRILPANVLRAEDVVAEARAEAQRLLVAASQEATAILGRAQAVLAEAQGQARIELEQARKAGAAEGLLRFERAILGLEQTSAHLHAEAAIEARRLAVHFARAILEVEFHFKPDRIWELLEPMLERAGYPPSVEIRLNPAEAELVAPRLEALRERLGWRGHARLRPDPAIPLHDIVVETACGSWSAGIERQLRPLLEHLDAFAAREEAR